MSFRLLSTFLLAFAALWVELPRFLYTPRFAAVATPRPVFVAPPRRRRHLHRRRSPDSPDH
jgi:hypothetical protein